MNLDHSQIVAHAHPNIALIKYWGKRDGELNLPAVSSLSITLDALRSTTQISPNIDQVADQMWLNKQICTPQQLTKVIRLADWFRTRSGSHTKLTISSLNNFPTAAGLASSASGYAALVKAMDAFFDTQLSLSQLSELARIGSGSAARSIFGGYVVMDKGNQANGEDSVAHELKDQSYWPLSVAIAITQETKKSVSSTIGMESTRLTSAYYQSWLDGQDADIQVAKKAVDQLDFEQLAQVSELSCLKMHGLMMSAQPGLLYWNAATLACLHFIRAQRAAGVPVFFTVDAGPQVKAICLPEFVQQISEGLLEISGVHRVIQTGLGRGAWLEGSDQ